MKKIVLAIAAVATAAIVVAKKVKKAKPVEQPEERLRPIWPYDWKG